MKILLSLYDSNNDSKFAVLKKPDVTIRVSAGLASTQAMGRTWYFIKYTTISTFRIMELFDIPDRKIVSSLIALG